MRNIGILILTLLFTASGANAMNCSMNNIERWQAEIAAIERQLAAPVDEMPSALFELFGTFADRLGGDAPGAHAMSDLYKGVAELIRRDQLREREKLLHRRTSLQNNLYWCGVR